MYRIEHWFPRNCMSGCGFNIILTEKWLEKVKTTSLDQEKINNFILNLGTQILEGHGFSKTDNPQHHLKVFWDEDCDFKLTLIQVCGNACQIGYDPYDQNFIEKGEIKLSPHNVDSIKQASMILTLFLKVVDYINMLQENV